MKNRIKSMMRRYQITRKILKRYGKRKVLKRLRLEKNSDAIDYRDKIEYLFVNQRIFLSDYDIITKYCLIFGQEWPNEYRKIDINVQFDKSNEMFFVVHNNRKMYFKKSFSEEECKEYYISILIEQDDRSPHRYRVDNQKWNNANIIDCGAAEGIFIIDHIADINHAFLFETDSEWVKAMQLTFKDYEKKITIFPKAIGKAFDENVYSLDYLYEQGVFNSDINIIKMDIEGNEVSAILGGCKFIGKQKNCTYYICLYHDGLDEKRVDELMNPFGYIGKKSEKLLYIWLGMNSPLYRVAVGEYKKG